VFYARLFAAAPSLRPVFPTDMRPCEATAFDPRRRNSGG
jgi:hypothetical protein